MAIPITYISKPQKIPSLSHRPKIDDFHKNCENNPFYYTSLDFHIVLRKSQKKFKVFWNDPKSHFFSNPLKTARFTKEMTFISNYPKIGKKSKSFGTVQYRELFSKIVPKQHDLLRKWNPRRKISSQHNFRKCAKLAHLTKQCTRNRNKTHISIKKNPKSSDF